MKGLYYLLIVILLLSACREPFDPDVPDHENTLVVDGSITNEPPPYTVRISRTSSLEYPEYKPFPGCTITLYDSEGQSEVLTERETGVYKTSATGIRGEPGKSYRIEITTNTGKHYRSDFVEMRESVSIDSAYAKIDYQQTKNFPEGLPGYQFYITTQRASDDTSHLFWSLEETYEYTSDFGIDAIYENYRMETNIPWDSLYRCWKTQDIKQIFTATTSNLIEPVIQGQPLHFVGTDTRQLMIRYSLKVKQHSINQSTYQYWNNLKEQISEEDFFFGRQPFQVGGNLYNPEQPEDLIRGYFMVSSVESKRIFVKRPKVEFLYPTCVLDTSDKFLSFLPPDQWPIYLARSQGKLGTAHDYCFDCRLRGGELRKPEFWDR